MHATSPTSPARHSAIETATAPDAGERYELRFTGLFDPGRGYSFPCDAHGHVDPDRLCERARANYFFARTVIGREFHAPFTLAVPEDAPRH